MNTITDKTPSINVIAGVYKKVIAAFKNRGDVQSGEALAYRDGQSLNGPYKIENKPKGIGDGLTSTGYCVSASQALLYDKIFQTLLKDRQAFAKLVSIDIREQFFGVCVGSGSQNRWHTAILIKDSGINFIIDITCSQFGNYFIGKDIWDFETWEKTFRSPNDKHIITDFTDNVLSYIPMNVNTSSKTLLTEDLEYSLHDITTVTDVERKTIADFFLNKIEIVNKKLIVGNLNQFDFKYMNNINTLLKNLNFAVTNEQYYIMEFLNKLSATTWIENFLTKGCILPQYITTSNTLKENCDYFGIDANVVNIESMNDKTFIVMKFDTCQGINIDFIKNTKLCIPYGMKLTLDQTVDIYNGSKDLSADPYGINFKTNTIIINCKL